MSSEISQILESALSNKHPLVTIIIPTMNSSATLARTLESIKSQTYKNIEVIIVDASATDSTKYTVNRYAGVILLHHSPERSSQLNFGASYAKGKYIYRVDSDFILEPRVVEEAVEVCERGANAALIHNASDATISYWAKVRKLERDCYRDDNTHVAIRFMRKADFIRVGGFLENLVAAEDYDLHNRLVKMGIRVGRVKAEEVHIGEPRRLRDVVIKHIYYGTKINEFMNSNPDTYWDQLTPMRFAYVRHWRDFLADPLASIGFLIYQYVRYASAMAGFIAASSERHKG